MASFSIRPRASGYTYFPGVSSPTTDYSEHTLIRVGRNYIGGLKFEQSLNSLFGTSASSISGLRVKSAYITVRITMSFLGPLHIAISNSEIDEDFTKIYSRTVASSGSSQDTFPTGNNTFNITSLFTTTNGNSTYLTPNDSTWYLYFKCSDSGRMSELSSTSYSTRVTTHENVIQYYNGSAWQTVTPYYYNGTSWVQCTAQYYNGTDWVQC